MRGVPGLAQPLFRGSLRPLCFIFAGGVEMLRKRAQRFLFPSCLHVPLSPACCLVRGRGWKEGPVGVLFSNVIASV